MILGARALSRLRERNCRVNHGRIPQQDVERNDLPGNLRLATVMQIIVAVSAFAAKRDGADRVQDTNMPV